MVGQCLDNCEKCDIMVLRGKTTYGRQHTLLAACRCGGSDVGPEYDEPDRSTWDIGDLFDPLLLRFYGRGVDEDELADFWDLVAYLHDRG